MQRTIYVFRHELPSKYRLFVTLAKGALFAGLIFCIVFVGSVPFVKWIGDVSYRPIIIAISFAFAIFGMPLIFLFRQRRVIATYARAISATLYYNATLSFIIVSLGSIVDLSSNDHFPSRFSVLTVSFAIGYIFYAFISAPFIWGIILWIKGPIKLIDEGFCPQCGYNLTGLDSNRCPECGNEIPLSTKTNTP